MSTNWHSPMYPTRDEIARSYDLWEQYVDPSHTMTEAEFSALSIKQRMEIMAETFGANTESA
jgi:hypothetical protein